jgi:hypothetical protein
MHQDNQPGDLSFTSSGFGFVLNFTANGNASGQDYASWTFRKAEKFFDVVTYTGMALTGRSITHNLGVTPALWLLSVLTADGNWCVAAGDSSGQL